MRVGVGRRLVALLSRARYPNVVVDPPPAGVTRTPDLAVPMPDGTMLRLDLYLPDPGSAGEAAHLARRPRSGSPTPGRYPVIMCAHPYGKDNLPINTRSGRSPSPQYRAFRQPQPVRFSAWTGWEAPDPAFWCSRGFAVVNADLRGFGHSDGVADLLTTSESQDYQHLIEWVADQRWCNGRVGLLGVSYLALSQYVVAARHPRGLYAMCPWEGFSDVYRDFARPGGGREDGFMVMWSAMTARAGRVMTPLRESQKDHPLLDGFWRQRTPDLAAIDTPMLVCGSFSDHLLHSRGSHEAFRRVGSADKWLYTHRGGKWCTFYSRDALAVQHEFFEDYLADIDTGWRQQPRVRLALHRDRTDHDVIGVEDMPPPATSMRSVRLAAGQVVGGSPWARDVVDLDMTERGSRGTISISWRVDQGLDVVGSPWLELPVAVTSGDDAILFAGLRLFRRGREVTFEGSYGFAHDMVTHSQIRLSHHELDSDLSAPDLPVHRHDQASPLEPGRVVDVALALLPQATALEIDDVLRLDLSGRWFFPTNPVTGQFPGRYQPSPAAQIRLHLSRARLHLPVWDQRPRADR